MRKMSKSCGLILAVTGFVLAGSFPASAAEDLEISGSVEIQYRSSDDRYDADPLTTNYPAGYVKQGGGDEIAPEELYIQVKKKLPNDVEALIKLDGSDMDKNKGDENYVEEAQVILKRAFGQPLTFIVGKDEMPFGQDYEQFFLSSVTHGLEIDKVWGVHANYKIKKFGSVAVAVFEHDRGADTKLTESFAVKGETTKLVKNLSVEASIARIGKSGNVEDDETRINAGAVFKLGDVTIHGEATVIANYGNVEDHDYEVRQVGADWRFKKFLFKGRFEEIEDDAAVVKENQIALGASYYFNKNTLASVEYEFTKWDGEDDVDEVLAGIKFSF